MTVEIEQVIPLLLEVCPGFEERWNDHVEYWGGEPAGKYNDVAEFVHYLVDSYAAGTTDCFDAAFQLIERLIVDGDDESRGLAVVGILEALQNASSWRPFKMAAFEPYLRPKSREAWDQLIELWRDKRSLPDVIRWENEHFKRGDPQ